MLAWLKCFERREGGPGCILLVRYKKDIYSFRNLKITIDIVV